MESKFSSRFLKQNNEVTEEQVSIPKEDSVPKISENNEIENDFRKALLEKIDTIPVWFEYSKNRQKELIKSFIDNKASVENIKISDIDKDVLADNLLDSITDFGAVQELLDKEKVNAVIVNGTKSIHIEIDGKILNTETRLNEKQLKFLINSISGMSGVAEFKGIKHVVVKDYSLIIAGKDVCLSGLNITIKKQNKFNADFLIKSGMLTKEIYDFLISAVDLKKNILISGGINSGKTVLLDAILSGSLKNKRAFVIEDTPQLFVDFNTITKFKNDEKVISYIVKSMPEYLVSDLNYIEPEFIDAKGVISTVRANSPESAFQALVGMCVVGGLPEKFARMKALKNFDYIVHLERGEDCVCRIVSILGLNPAKTIQASIKTIVKYIDGEYVSKIPQPITSMRAKSLKS